MIIMDDTDRKIISILRKNSKTAFVKIAERSGLTEGAVRARVKNLVLTGEIKKFTVNTREEFGGIILINTFADMPTGSVAEKIRSVGIDDVYETSGNYEIICLVQSDSVKSLNAVIERIRKIKGIKSTNTCMVLK